MPLAEAAPHELMALSSAAHWNQNEEDWGTMLALGRGWGLRSDAGTLIASTLVLPYEGAAAAFAWVSMVLVLPDQRGQGHAQRLLRVALDDLERNGLLPVLDATPAGRPVYLKEGFVDGWAFDRWRRKAGIRSLARKAEVEAKPLREGDWLLVEALDAPAFGADRMPLLRRLAARAPQAAWVAEAGYLLGREGRTALQFGPLVADEDEIAISLLAAALDACAAEAAQRDVIVDLRDGRDSVAVWLREQGFSPERPFTRMVRGAHAKTPGDSRRVVLVAGPELG